VVVVNCVIKENNNNNKKKRLSESLNNTELI